MNKKNIGVVGACLFAACIFSLLTCGHSTKSDTPRVIDIDVLKSQLDLKTEEDPETGYKISRGTFAVYEDREAQSGRIIHLDVVILHAKGPNIQPDPYFEFAGGPGADVTTRWKMHRNNWIREERDIVLISQRGTGGDNRLDCPKAADDNDIQGYLSPLFRDDIFKECLDEVSKIFDLTKYSTCLAADDFNDIRRALGYNKINVSGTSYGSRMGLVYLRRYPETVRTAILCGLVPIAFRNPLYHSRNFHHAIRALFAECANDSDCHTAFPNLEDEYLAILDRLEQAPAEVTIPHPATKEPVTILLDKNGFTEGLRTTMYSSGRTRLVPYLIHRAFEGDLQPFAIRAVQSSRSIRKILALGMLLSVICAEDMDRVTEEDIVEIATWTDAGDSRVRTQKAACEYWPRTDIPADYGDPVSVNVPVLLLSGNLDPVTPPEWGEETARHLPNSLHLVVPGAHGVGGKCIRTIEQQFLKSGTLEGLDISCTQDLKPRKFKISD
jgi:pimeloyl-ACP methyl ester carboxylesterase